MITTNFFDEQIVTQRTPIISLKSIYGLSAIRDIWSGDVTSDGIEFIIKAEANGAQDATLDTAERGPYPPGYELEPGFAARLSTVPTGGQGCEFGYHDDADGWFYDVNALGMFAVRRRDSVEVSRVIIGKWYGNRLTSPNIFKDYSFSPFDGHMYSIPFSWYGFGPTQYAQQRRSKSKLGKWMNLFHTTRSAGETSVAQPHLPIRFHAYTSAGDDAFEIRATGRQISVIGNYNPVARTTSIDSGSVSLLADVWTPVMAIRRRSVYPYAPTKLGNIDVDSEDTIRLALVENGSVESGGTWATPEDYVAAETLLEVNQDPQPTVTDITTGTLIFKHRYPTGDKKDTPDVDMRSTASAPLIEDRAFLVFAKPVSGASSIKITMNMREDW